MKKITIILSMLLILTGCSEDSQSELTDTPIGTYAKNFDDVSKFSNVYGMWKNNIDTLYIQAGIDEYTDTYLLESMPHIYSTVIKSLDKYNMKAYALLDNDVWLTNEDNLALEEINKILDYNTKFSKEKFEGININPNLKNASDEKLEMYYRNLEETKQAISLHNDIEGDNLTLSINIDNESLNNDKLLNVAKIVDEIIYEDKFNSIEDIEEALSIMDQYAKKVVIVVDSDNDFFENNYITLLNDLNKKLNSFNKYESFNGFVINDYNKYSEKIKRP